MEKNIPVISSDSLLLSSSQKVQFLVALIRFILNPKDKENNYRILEFLTSNSEGKHDFIYQHLNHLEPLLENHYGFRSANYRGQSLLDTMELAIRTFELIPNSDAHITGFMDFVFEIEQKLGTDSQTFLDKWESNEGKLSISTPEKTTAVQVMTIHKSKGLEFPVVIFPYANTKVYEEIDPKLWVPVDPKSFLGFSELLISKKQEVKNYGELEASLYSIEHQKLQLDAYNLLYVALTRPINCLYIISYKDLDKGGNFKEDYYSGLFIHYLNSKGIWDESLSEYEFGTIQYKASMSSHEKNLNIPYIYTHKDRTAFKIHTKANMLWNSERETAIEQGNIFHHILGEVHTKNDLDKALGQALKRGILEQSSYEKVDALLRKVVHHPNLHEFYDKDVQVLNEKELLLSDGSILRPDRVVIQNKKVHIIDYKTGKKSPKYKEQLESYANAFLDMGYEVENKIIAYINEDIILEYI